MDVVLNDEPDGWKDEPIGEDEDDDEEEAPPFAMRGGRPLGLIEKYEALGHKLPRRTPEEHREIARQTLERVRELAEAHEGAERTIWNGHFAVSFRDGRVRRFRWQHLAASAADAHRSLVAAARREYPDATRIRCHVLPAEEAE